MDIEIFSFFSGLGFLDLAFEDAGFNIVFVNEYNKVFLDSYRYARRNRNHQCIYGYSHENVKKYLEDEFWQTSFQNYNNRENKIIGFIGGPPCPDFSTAGKNEGEKGENGQLTSVYVNLIIKREPDFFVLENVKGLYQTKKHKAFYERMKRKLYRAGYSLFDSLENALEYGVPQNRDRLILVGFKRKFFGRNLKFTIGQHKQYMMDEINRCNWPTVNPFMENGNLAEPEGIIRDLTVQYWFQHNDVVNHPNGQDVFAVKNQQRFIGIDEGDVKGKSFKRLHRWRYSPTAAYGNNEVHLHPYLPRRISVAEALALQSLPNDFELPNNISLSAKFKMVGNGVPYLLALGIANDIYEWLGTFVKNR